MLALRLVPAQAKEAFEEAKAGQGGGMLEAMREAVAEGGEGGATAALFGIINKALRREAKAKGGKGGRAAAVKARPQVLLSALFEDDNKEKGVVITTARKVLAEVQRISARTNRAQPLHRAGISCASA